MEKQIAVPAESARKMAISAVEDGVPELKEKGLHHSAEATEKHAAKILAATAGNSGEFVSVDARALGSVVAESFDFSHHRDAARHFLKQYGIWG